MTTEFSHALNPLVKPTAKPLNLAGSYALAMEISAIRLENLRFLVREIQMRNPHWKQKDIASALGMSASYLSQLTGGKKMGDDVARKVEDSHHLPRGWMDALQEAPVRHVAEAGHEYVSRPLRIDPERIAAALQLIRLSFLNLGFEFDPEENGLPVAMAYDFLADRSEKSVTASNLLEFKPRLEQLRGNVHEATPQDRDRRSRTGTG